MHSSRLYAGYGVAEYGFYPSDDTMYSGMDRTSQHYGRPPNTIVSNHELEPFHNRPVLPSGKSVCYPDEYLHYRLSEEQLAGFRTTLCVRHKHNQCHSAEKCPYSHCLTWQRRDPYICRYIPRLCPEIEFVKKGNKMFLIRKCIRNRACPFAHSKEEELYHPLMYKTKMCSSVPCCKRYFCPFGHSPEEVRNPMEFPLIKKVWGSNSPIRTIARDKNNFSQADIKNDERKKKSIEVKNEDSLCRALCILLNAPAELLPEQIWSPASLHSCYEEDEDDEELKNPATTPTNSVTEFVTGSEEGFLRTQHSATTVTWPSEDIINTGPTDGNFQVNKSAQVPPSLSQTFGCLRSNDQDTNLSTSTQFTHAPCSIGIPVLSYFTQTDSPFITQHSQTQCTQVPITPPPTPITPLQAVFSSFNLPLEETTIDAQVQKLLASHNDGTNESTVV